MTEHHRPAPLLPQLLASNLTAEQRAFQREARQWLVEHVPRKPLPSSDTREGFAVHVEWERTLFHSGWSVVAWPAKFGGRDKSILEWLIFEDEYYRAGAPNRVTQNGMCLLAPTLFAFGTEEQKDRILPKIAAAQELWCQGWSEPNAGSDLAALESRAERVEGGFRLNGQKAWCTRGAFCDSIFGIFRTGAPGSRHRGLTYLMASLRTPGVTVRPVRRLDGDDGFADVFFEDVFVPDCDVLGEVDKGWRVAMSTTSSERGLTLRSPGRFLASAERLLSLFHRQRATETPGAPGTPGTPGAPDALERVLQAWMDSQAYNVYTWHTASRMLAGESIEAESSLNKIFWSEMDVRAQETALALLGPQGALDTGATSDPSGWNWMRSYEFSLAGPIYAGTNEIQRNIVAERLLGLPRE